MLLVTGPTGQIGRELVRLLREGGAEFRVLVGREGRAGELREQGLEVVEANFDRAQSLAPAFAKVDAVALILPLHPDMVEQKRRLLQAAVKAKVSRVVNVSSYGAHLDSPCRALRAHAESEQDVRGSGLEWVQLRPHFPMQNLLMYRPGINQEGSLYVPMGNGRISIVDARDVSAAAAKVLTEGGHAGSEYELTGPEALTFGEMAEKLSAVLRRRVAYVDVRPATARQDMIRTGASEWLADAILELYEIYREDLATAITDAVEKITGERPRGFDEFAVDYAHHFEKKRRERGTE